MGARTAWLRPTATHTAGLLNLERFGPPSIN
jgi:hypothetical protein